MNVILFVSDSHYYKYLKPIHLKLINENHNSFFLYTESNITKIPTHDMNDFNYDFNSEFNFNTGIYSDSLSLDIPYIPDYLILVRDRWQPEQSIIKEFKEKFGCKIALVEINSQYYNVIESRLEMISRTKYPQNMIDIIFDHSDFILNTRKQLMDWDKWDSSIVVGNPCYDDFSEGIDDAIYQKYDIDSNKKQILFFGLINMDRKIALELLKNLIEKCGDEYQIFYKPYPGEPYSDAWKSEYNPKFFIDGVQVIYDHLDIFQMYNVCDIHIGAISSVMYPSLLLGKKVVNINNFCKYLNTGNDISRYENETKDGIEDSADFWMGVHKLNTLEDFRNLVDLERIEEFKGHNNNVQKIIREYTYDYDYDLKFLEDETPKDYTELLKIFDEFNDKNASSRIVKILEEKIILKDISNEDEVCIVLQGYSIGKSQLESLYNKYRDMGFRYIIISSYSSCIPDYLLNRDFVINNDEILGQYDCPHPPNINYQLITTRLGIELCFKLYPTVKYVMKHRLDIEINNLDKWVVNWIELINNRENTSKFPLSKKIVSMNRFKAREVSRNQGWYIVDYWNFGTKDDMKLIWGIPMLNYHHPRAEDYISTAFLGNDRDNDAEDYYIYSPKTVVDVYSHKWDECIYDRFVNANLINK